MNKIKNLKKFLTAGILSSGLFGCSVSNKLPYVPLPICEGENYFGKKVNIEGEIFLLEEKGLIILSRELCGLSQIGVRVKGKYFSSELKKTLEKEMTDSDNEMVKVYGLLTREAGSTYWSYEISGDFVEVEGVKYPVR